MHPYYPSSSYRPLPPSVCIICNFWQLHAVVATVQAGFLTGIPTTMVEDIAPCLKAIDDAVMEHPKVVAAVIKGNACGICLPIYSFRPNKLAAAEPGDRLLADVVGIVKYKDVLVYPFSTVTHFINFLPLSSSTARLNHCCVITTNIQGHRPPYSLPPLRHVPDTPPLYTTIPSVLELFTHSSSSNNRSESTL